MAGRKAGEVGSPEGSAWAPIAAGSGKLRPRAGFRATLPFRASLAGVGWAEGRCGDSGLQRRHCTQCVQNATPSRESWYSGEGHFLLAHRTPASGDVRKAGGWATAGTSCPFAAPSTWRAGGFAGLLKPPGPLFATREEEIRCVFQAGIQVRGWGSELGWAPQPGGDPLPDHPVYGHKTVPSNRKKPQNPTNIMKFGTTPALSAGFRRCSSGSPPAPSSIVPVGSWGTGLENNYAEIQELANMIGNEGTKASGGPTPGCARGRMAE